ncbi:alpha/beta fold hydrolase [uncultured Brevundimonas sp.]|uniref:S9 family peptidase n=1 Tax=uncultured Brevundimonas sp. TaxID=213418 RepID=UPI002617CC13|nr:alpha/beta fold hydrolase [uncultured Brevundimonas sp.]
MITGSVRAAAAALSRRDLIWGAGALAALGAGPGLTPIPGGPGPGAVPPYPLETFFTPDQTRAAVLSPSGRRIAVLQQLGSGPESAGAIDLIEAADPEGERRRISLGDLEAEALQWGNDDRLLVRVAVTRRTGSRTAIGSHLRIQGIELTSRRILSVGADSGDIVVLFQDQRQRLRHSLDMGRVIDLLPADPDHVLMVARERDGALGLHRVDIHTGAAERLERGSLGTYAWRTQGGAAVMRHDINARGTLETVYARAPGETGWKMVRRTRVIDAPDFAWVGETDRPGVVLVSARAEGEDTESVRELDLRTLAFGPPVHGREGRDVLYGLTDSAGRYLGAAYYGERLEYAFDEPALAAHHRALNRFLDDDCDVHLTDVDVGRNRFIAYATGPREPGAWFFYDREARAVVNVGAARVLDPGRLGACETLSVRTRDGAVIEAYLTAPPGGAAGPLVVLPHGGPEARDLRGWDRQVQALAAQGWWVLQPNFRGSGGYGLGFARQGWTRWGDRMQEDVEDAVEHAIALRGLDRDRVAIMGTSYGGYAALMGAVRRPDLYKAAISICGVCDLPEMLAWENREDDTPGKPIYEFWVRRIGDPAAMGPALETASPRRRAAEVACPVLLVHGVDDAIVPVTQSRRMRDALRAAGGTVELIEVADAGHADWEDAREHELTIRYVALFRSAFAAA